MEKKSSMMRVDKTFKILVDNLIKEYEKKWGIKITTKEATKLFAKKLNK